jgi:hypothetical protein
MLHSITANVTGKTRRRFRGGREYLVAPLTLIVPGVLNGSQGPLYYPADEVERDFMAWNEMPIVVYHPQSTDGTHVSAQSPGVLDKQGIGYVRKPAYNGKLTAEGWFDAERTRTVDQRVYDALLRNEPQELSTGLYTDNEPAENGATAPDGRPYTHVARNYRPDHLAILPDQIGACSLRDGCGVLVNRNPGDTTMSDEQKLSVLQSLAVLLGVENAYNPNQPRDDKGRFGSGGGGGATGGKGASKAHGAAKSGAGAADADKASQANGFKDAADEDAFETMRTSLEQQIAGGMTETEKSDWRSTVSPKTVKAVDSTTDGLSRFGDDDKRILSKIVDGSGNGVEVLDFVGTKYPFKESEWDRLVDGKSTGPIVGSRDSANKLKVLKSATSILKKRMGKGQSGQTRNQRRRRSDMTKSREEIVDNLIENSCCWDEADRDELMDLTDNQLNKLDAALEKQLQADAVVNAAREGFGMDSKITVNAMPEFIKKKMAAAEDEEEEVVDEEKPTGNALTQEQMEDIAFARSIKQERKDAAISVITGNAQNKFTKEQLNAMPLNTLQNLAELAKPIVNESQNVPSYFGAAVPPTTNVGTKDDDNDYLPLPTVNWSKQASA